MRKIVIIGAGNMGSSLGGGLLERDGWEVLICTREESVAYEAERWKKYGSRVKVLEKKDIKSLKLTEEDAIVLCTKPQGLIPAAADWGELVSVSDKTTVISILAGVPIAAVRKHFSKDLPTIRAMPNVCSSVFEGATVVSKDMKTPEKSLKVSRDIFNSVGKTWEALETHLDAVTALSGSGPAYVAMIIEALSDGGVNVGLPRKLAQDLATQTVLGASKLLQASGEHPAIVRDRVTTPAGTTISAIHELEKHGLRTMLISAVATATKKSRSLSEVVEDNFK